MSSPQVSLRVRFEKPVNLAGYEREFIKSYISELNAQIDKNAPKFSRLFLDVHERKDAWRNLRPDYTGAMADSIDAEWTNLPTNIFTFSPSRGSPRGLLTVGYRPEHDRTPIYIPAIEGGWSGARGFTANKVKSNYDDRGYAYVKHKIPRRGQVLSISGSEGNTKIKGRIDVKNSPKFKDLKPAAKMRSSSRGKRAEGEASKRIREWAIKRLGLHTLASPDRRRWDKVERARYFAIKQSIFTEGNLGRNTVERYAKNSEVQELWTGINEDIINRVSKQFSIRKTDKKIISAVIGRGVGL